MRVCENYLLLQNLYKKSNLADLGSKYSQLFFAELIATFIFVFIAIGSINSALYFSSPLTEVGLIIIALGNGLAIFISIASMGRISGAHLNPAVTLAMLIAGKIDMVKSFIYIVGQLSGSCLAALSVSFFIWSGSDTATGAHSLADGISLSDGVIIEFVLTFVLVFTVFSAISDKPISKLPAAVTIGIVVTANMLIAIPLTGASMNPARSFGPALVNGTWLYHWIYWVGPISGALVGAVIYTLLIGSKTDRTSIGVIRIR